MGVGFGFLVIVGMPFGRRACWAWWACWVPMLANLTYTFTLAHYSTTTLTYSLIADVILPVVLLLHIPPFLALQGAPTNLFVSLCSLPKKTFSLPFGARSTNSPALTL